MVAAKAVHLAACSLAILHNHKYNFDMVFLIYHTLPDIIRQSSASNLNYMFLIANFHKILTWDFF